MSQRKMDPEYRALDVASCPVCGNFPEDKRVLGKTDDGMTTVKKIWCDLCDSVYDVEGLTA